MNKRLDEKRVKKSKENDLSENWGCRLAATLVSDTMVRIYCTIWLFYNTCSNGYWAFVISGQVCASIELPAVIRKRFSDALGF